MQKTLLHIYALLICFVSTTRIMVQSKLILSASMDWKLTTLKHRVSLEKILATMRIFVAYKAEKDPKKYPIYRAMSQEELEEVRIQERSRRIFHIKSDAIKDIMTYVGWLSVACICFFIHFRVYKGSLT